MSDQVSARRTQTRERLVDAAARVFAEKGVLGASVEEICEAAGFTRGAFYSNFESKEELCLALLQHQADAHLLAAREAVAPLTASRALGEQSLDEAIDTAVALFLGTQPSDRESILAGAELRLYAAREESLRPGYLEFLDRCSSTFGDLISDAAAAYGYRLTLPTGQLISVLHGIFENGAINGLITGGAGDMETRSELLSVVLKSFLNPDSPEQH